MTKNNASDLYDAVNGWGPSDDLFLGFVTTVAGECVLDLGCGTGQITIAAAKAGCTVTGVDPDRPSLQAARAKPGADRVVWIDGNSRAIPATALFDVALVPNHPGR